MVDYLERKDNQVKDILRLCGEFIEKNLYIL